MWDVITNAHRYQPQPGDKVLDLGAHYGIFALYCAARGALVDAFEPQPVPYGELCHTAQVADEIDAGRIYCHQKAVWKDARILEMFHARGGSSATASAVRETGPFACRVATEPFDELLLANGAFGWDCVKMDVEGAEFEILTTSKQLSRIGFLTVEIHNDLLRPEQTKEIENVLRKEFSVTDRLPRKDNFDQTVAWFCRR